VVQYKSIRLSEYEIGLVLDGPCALCRAVFAICVFFFGIHSELDLNIFRLDYFLLTQSTEKNINNKPTINSSHFNFFNSKTLLHGQIKYLHIFLLQILHPITLDCLGDKGFPKIKPKYKCKTYPLKLMSNAL
jgi:hypothetical protein